MRSLQGEIVLPPDAPASAKSILVEVRDVSVADAPSTVVASRTLHDRKLESGGRVKFSLSVPETDPRRRLEVRVHVDVDGTGRITSGDLLTTESIAVPASGNVTVGVKPV